MNLRAPVVPDDGHSLSSASPPAWRATGSPAPVEGVGHTSVTPNARTPAGAWSGRSTIAAWGHAGGERGRRVGDADASHRQRDREVAKRSPVATMATSPPRKPTVASLRATASTVHSSTA